MLGAIDPKVSILVWAIIIPIIIFIVLSLIFMVAITMSIAKTLYKMQWTRAKNINRVRECSDPSIDYHLDMYNQGLDWRKANLEFMEEVQIQRDGLNFYGEYFNFGAKKTVIIVPGRTECCHYSCYYAEPFKKAGLNVLCIDQRTNGLSDGDVITLGIEEHLDLKKWGEFVHDKYHQEQIIVYGICGGATTALLLYTSKEKPEYFKGLITDGMYFTFREVYKQHIIALKKPVYPVLDELIWLLKHRSKINPKDVAPSKLIQTLDEDILIMHGKNDAFTKPEYAKKLYNLCPSKNKCLVFLNARHSHLRYDDTEQFDLAVSQFVSKYE